MKEPDRLLTLDAMRGIAAICVMVTHVNVPGTPHLVGSGYLAVGKRRLTFQRAGR